MILHLTFVAHKCHGGESAVSYESDVEPIRLGVLFGRWTRRGWMGAGYLVARAAEPEFGARTVSREHTPKERATVGALRSLATDVDVTRMPREKWRKRNERVGIGVFGETP